VKRRGFLTALGALCTTAVLPSVPSIPIADPTVFIKLAMNSMYGKFGGSRYEETGARSWSYDIRSAYPFIMNARKNWKEQ